MRFADSTRQLKGSGKALWGLCALLCLSFTAGVAHAAGPLQVSIVYEGSRSTHRAVVAAIQENTSNSCQELVCAPIEWTLLDMQGGAQEQTLAGADLVVALGATSQQIRTLAASESAAVLYGLISAADWETLQSCCGEIHPSQSAIFTDQPLARSLALTRALLPKARHAGVLLGNRSGRQLGQISETAAQIGLVPVFARVEEAGQVGSKMRSLQQEVDVWLGIPDRDIYNRNTLYGILLTAYAARQALIGYSRPLVRAGAAAAVYSSADDVAYGLAGHIRAYANSGELPPASYPENFSIELNPQVLRSLKIAVPPSDRLRQQVQALRPQD